MPVFIRSTIGKLAAIKKFKIMSDRSDMVLKGKTRRQQFLKRIGSHFILCMSIVELPV